MRRIIIRNSEKDGDGTTCKWPHPDSLMGGQWLLLPRNEPIEVDERAIMRQKDKCVIEEIEDPMTHKKTQIRRRIYPVDFLD